MIIQKLTENYYLSINQHPTPTIKQANVDLTSTNQSKLLKKCRNEMHRVEK